MSCSSSADSIAVRIDSGAVSRRAFNCSLEQKTKLTSAIKNHLLLDNVSLNSVIDLDHETFENHIFTKRSGNKLLFFQKQKQDCHLFLTLESAINASLKKILRFLEIVRNLVQTLPFFLRFRGENTLHAK